MTHRLTTYRWLSCWLLPALFLLAGSLPVVGQGSEPVRRQLVRADALFQASVLDSSRLILECLLDRPMLSADLNEYQRLHAELLTARIDEEEGYYSTAMEAFLRLRDRSHALDYPDMELLSLIGIALVHEQTGDADNCAKHLELATDLLQTRGLDSLASELYIRQSSYHRIFGSREVAITYARLALESAGTHDRLVDWAIAHHLLGMLHRADEYATSLYHFERAARAYGELQRDNNIIFIWLNLVRLHGQFGYPDAALMASDSAMHYFQRAVAHNEFSPQILSVVHERRAEVLEQNNQLDSALYHLRLSHAYDREFAEQEHLSRVLEIQSRYDDEVKSRRLHDQAYQLDVERQRRQNLLIAFVVLVALLGALGYLYFRLSTTKATVEEQSASLLHINGQLEEALEEQIILREELNHRVKNNLQLILSLLDAQGANEENDAFTQQLDGLTGRIQSMAVLHNLLHDREESARLPLADYCRSLCLQFTHFAEGPEAPEFHFELGDHRFEPRVLTPLGLVLNELITNSLKYAGGSGRKMTISMRLNRDRQTYCLRYQDNGPGFPSGSFAGREGGLGSYLIHSMGRQLNGWVESRNDRGAQVDFYFRPRTSAETASPELAGRE